MPDGDNWDGQLRQHGGLKKVRVRVLERRKRNERHGRNRSTSRLEAFEAEVCHGGVAIKSVLLFLYLQKASIYRKIACIMSR